MIASPDIIVGIDLGTTFSLVAYCDDRGPQVIRDENGVVGSDIQFRTRLK